MIKKFKNIRKKTIQDFGNQWRIHGEIKKNFWSSKLMFKDHFGKLFNPIKIKNKTICEIGSGSGRILAMILNYNPKLLYAVEPSISGYKKIKKNFNNFKNLKKLKIINKSGENFKISRKFDYIFSIGVLHHIINPSDVIKNARRHLKKNGSFLIWVYGYENNKLYLRIYNFLCIITKILPDKLLDILSSSLNYLIEPYIYLCKFINLPLKNYLIKVFSKCGWKERKYIIFDQLNPEYAKYYKKEELKQLLKKNGFNKLEFYHRHKYSWTVKAKK